MIEQPRLGFVSYADAADVRSWSGTPYYLSRMLRKQGVALDLVSPLCKRFILPFRARTLLHRRLGWKAYLWDREPLVLDAFARAAARRLKHSRATVAFSPGTPSIAHLRCRQPIVFWTDMTFPASLDFYLPRDAISPASLKAGFAMEQAAVERAELAILSSDWARDSMLANYRIDPSKVITIPFGANLDWQLTGTDVEQFIAGRSRSFCKLAFVGVNWARKGGPRALEIARALNECGLRTHLTIVGCEPPCEVADYVTVHPFLNKSTPEGLAQFQQIMAESHFLILPTLADCTPLVIGEASAFGVPCAVTNVGGIPSQVRNGSNGQMFAMAQTAEDWAQWIAKTFEDAEAYSQLARSARQEYTTRMTWDASVRTFLAELKQRGLLESR